MSQTRPRRLPPLSWHDLTRPIVAIPAGMFIAAALGMFRIGEKNLWLDESTSWQFAGRLLQRLPDVPDVNMTLYYGLLAVWRQYVPDTEAGLRALSVVFAVLTVPAAYALVRRMFDQRVAALVAIVIVPLDVFIVRYAQETRGYSLLILMAVVSTYLFVRAWERGGWLSWATYGLVAAAGLYVHFFAGFVIAAHGLTFLVIERRGAFRLGPVMAAALFTLGAVPLLYAIATKGGCQIAWIRPPTLDLFLTEVSEVGGQAAIALAAGYIALSILAVLLALRGADGRRRRAVMILAAWAITPIVGALLISAVQPVFVLRYVVIGLPPLLFLAAFGAASLRPRPVGIVAVGAIVLTSSIGLAYWYSQPSEEHWEAAVRHVVASSEPADGVIYYTRSGRKPFAYYARRLDAVDQTPLEVWTPKEPCDEDPGDYVAELAAIGEQTRQEHARIWVVLTHTEIWDPPPELRALYAEMDAGYALASKATFGYERYSGHLIEIRLYERSTGRVAAAEGERP